MKHFWGLLYDLGIDKNFEYVGVIVEKECEKRRDEMTANVSNYSAWLFN